METQINGKDCYIYFPYFSENVIEIDFKDGGTYRMSSDIITDMGFCFDSIPIGDRRGL